MLVGDATKHNDYISLSQINSTENKNKFVIPKTVSRKTTASLPIKVNYTHANRFDIPSEDNVRDEPNIQNTLHVRDNQKTTQHQLNGSKHNNQDSTEVKNRRPSKHDVNNVINNHQCHANTHIQKVVPGNGTYREACKFGKKTFVFGTSMIKGVRQNEFNRNLTSCSARFRTFPGATLKQLNHYIYTTYFN